MSELIEGEIIKGYKIIRSLGSGAVGRVYLGQKKNFLFALKEIASFASPEKRKLAYNTFRQETKLLKNIKHPAFPVFYETFEYRDSFFIVMKYIKGDPLEKLVSEAKDPFSEEKVVYWAIQLCEVLFYLHTLSPKSIIYRDLKPGNIIISPDNTVKLIDFGVARYYDPNKDSDTIRLGTPGYAAPEQCREEGQSTPRTDIYALGVLMHHLLTLHDPSSAPFRLPPIKKFNSQVSDQLIWIIEKASSLSPRDRYLDADLLKEELLDYYGEKFGFYRSPYKLREVFYLNPLDLKVDFSIKQRFRFYTGAGSIVIILLFLGALFFPRLFAPFFCCSFPVWIIVMFIYFIHKECEGRD